MLEILIKDVTNACLLVISAVDTAEIQLPGHARAECQHSKQIRLHSITCSASQNIAFVVELHDESHDSTHAIDSCSQFHVAPISAGKLHLCRVNC